MAALLLQLYSANRPTGERETVQRVAPPLQIEQIGKAVSEALRKAGQPDLPAIVRIWVSDGYRQERARSGAEDKEDGQQARGGWGFFIIQKHEEPPSAAAGGARYLVELFLYQEGAHARRDRR